MRTTSRRRAIVFFVTFGVCLVSIAVALNVSWIIFHWRAVVPLVMGIIFFGMIIAGLILNTIFLVREVRRNEQHDSFINAVTHELKTPIASIHLYLETLLTRNVEEEKKREFYNVMLADAKRLLDTVEQTLKAGEIGQRGSIIARSEVDIVQVIEDCVALARSRHNLNPDALLCLPNLVPGYSTFVLADRDELNTAFSNLLDNAIKYSPELIKVRAEVSTPDGYHVVVRIRDSGVGIPSAELKRVFKRFYRVRNRPTSLVKGTGLGLFIVRAIVRKYGGKVSAQSGGEGQGTTVTVQMPTTPSRDFQSLESTVE